MWTFVILSAEAFAPALTFSTVGQMIQLIGDFDAYGFTLTPR